MFFVVSSKLAVGSGLGNKVCRTMVTSMKHPSAEAEAADTAVLQAERVRSLLCVIYLRSSRRHFQVGASEHGREFPEILSRLLVGMQGDRVTRCLRCCQDRERYGWNAVASCC